MGNNRYLDIARQLMRRIARGDYPPGSSLPPRLELAKEFQVARATIDRCIEHLTSSGVLSSRHGSGTYVNESGGIKFNGAFVSGSAAPQSRIFNWQHYSYDELKEKSRRDVLARHDGVIWFQPDAEALEQWTEELKGRVPQVLVNRTQPGVPCVSTDHRGAYREITTERLKLYPDALPVLIKLDAGSAVLRYREEGFIDACRAEGRFYDQLYLPMDFNAKLQTLRDHAWQSQRPLLLVSVSLMNTGAVMRWIGEKNFSWRRDVLYSDFDNDLPEYIFGVKVSSYVQNDADVLEAAENKLAAIITGDDTSPDTILSFPRRINGDT